MGSVTVLDKSDVLSGLFGTWDSLDVLLSGLSEQQWQTPTPLPGWCVHNVVAHIVGTESVLQGLSSPDADFDASTLDHVRNDVGAANEAWVRHLSTESGAALLRAVPLDYRRSAAAFDRHVRRRLECADSDTGWSGEFRAIHAGAAFRLLDARAGHPRRRGPAVIRRGVERPGRRVSRWTRSPRRWATSSANSVKRPKGRESPSN